MTNNAKLDRRTLIKQGATAAAVGSSLALTDLTASAGEANHAKDERYFIFVELKGGAQWSTALSAPSMDWIRSNWSSFRFLPVDKEGGYGITREMYKSLGLPFQSECPAIATPYCNSGVILPIEAQLDARIDEYGTLIKDSYKTVTTVNNQQIHMGFAAKAFWDTEKRYYDEIALVQGVHMLGGFHGTCNRELYSGRHGENEAWHVAAIIAKSLRKYNLGGPNANKMLDNIYLDGATINTSLDDQYAAPTIPVSSFAISALADVMDSPESRINFERAMRLTESYGSLGLQPEHIKTILSYKQGMPYSREVLSSLRGLKDKKLIGQDFTLNLKQQMKLGTELIEQGLSRVVNLCFGTRNRTNNVDEFGLFDSHISLYTKLESDYQMAHHIHLNHAMEAVGQFIDWGRTKKHPVSGRRWLDHVTLVFSSEFGRGLNLSGSFQLTTPKDSLGRRVVSVGSGHNVNGNVYLLAGAGIRPGAVVSSLDPATAAAPKDKAIRPQAIIRTLVEMIGEGSRYKDFYPLDNDGSRNEILSEILRKA